MIISRMVVVHGQEGDRGRGGFCYERALDEEVFAYTRQREK